ncbi:MAG: AAA family ATPase [Deltaproteobacteria bacterium]|jgi:chromosomal replication initiator protein|nr:AAA family ATPase [Deltaproteobacteria bacterium]
MENIWPDICRKLAQTMEDTQYKRWILPLEAEFKEGALSVSVSNEFVRNFVFKHYRALISCAADELLGRPVLLDIRVREREETEEDVSCSPPETEEASAAFEACPNLPALIMNTSSPRCRPDSDGENGHKRSFPGQSGSYPWRHSFEDFVVGPCNELAYAAARNLCAQESSVPDFHLLYLFSPPGLGKTHLLHSVGASLSRKSNLIAPQIEYTGAGEFAGQLRQLLRGNDLDRLGRFKARFHNADVLLLEDLHLIQKMEKTQNELLSVISSLLDKGGKVVFSSSLAPRELREMDDQLRSRLGAGIIASLGHPDMDTRRRIINSKATARQLYLSDEITEYLAENMRSDVRQIESCLLSLACKARELNRNVSLELVREILVDHLDRVEPALPEIIRLVCEAFGLSPEALKSKSRRQEHVQARDMAFHLARKYTDLSLQEIGRAFNRSHSTVSKGIEALRLEIDRQSHSGRQLSRTLALIERSGKLSSPGQV